MTIRKTFLILFFYPCHYGFSYLHMGLTQIPWCWLATTSPGADLTPIPLWSLATWNMWPFIIMNKLIITPGHLKIMMNLSCQNPQLSFSFHCVCSNMCMITPQLRSLWLTVNVSIKMIMFTFLTTKLFIKVCNIESMCLVNQQPQLCQISQSRQVSWLTISHQTCYLHTIKKLYNHATVVKPF